MKKIGFVLMGMLLLASNSYASKKNSKVQWVTFEALDSLLRQAPKKVLVDVYANWCTWCKRMDKDIYNHEQAAAYINEHYYAVKLNAETKEPIVFKGETFTYDKRYKMNGLALKLCNYEPSLPATVILNATLTKSVPFGGYLEIYQMESILKYYVTNAFESQKWTDWNRSFIIEWGDATPKKK